MILMKEIELRRQLVAMLSEPNAHLAFEKAVSDFPSEYYGTSVGGFVHTAWQLLEHLRIAQWDIMEFSRDPKHVSPPFPDGYWPAKDDRADNKAWNQSLEQFKSDLNRMCDLITDESNDLFAKIPHGDGQTLLREALVLAKHNSYHLGQLVAIKKALTRSE
jgi:hypothetical protein